MAPAPAPGKPYPTTFFPDFRGIRCITLPIMSIIRERRVTEAVRRGNRIKDCQDRKCPGGEIPPSAWLRTRPEWTANRDRSFGRACVCDKRARRRSAPTVEICSERSVGDDRAYYSLCAAYRAATRNKEPGNETPGLG